MYSDLFTTPHPLSMEPTIFFLNFGIGTKTDGAPEEYMTYGHNQAPSSSYYAYSMALH
jgi:hypothetical protein